MESGWRLKPLHRLILTSATYQLASRPSPQPTTEELELWTQLENADPDNRWLARGHRRRLEAEAIRDAMLAVSGELNRKQGGPGVFAPLPDAVASTLLENQWPVTENEAEHARPQHLHVCATEFARPTARSVRQARFQPQLSTPLSDHDRTASVASALIPNSR